MPQTSFIECFDFECESKFLRRLREEGSYPED